MRYFVEVAGREHEVHVTRRPDGSLSVGIAGKELPVEALRLGAREWSMRVGDRMLDVSVEGSAPAVGVIASGVRTYVKVESERMRSSAQALGPGARKEQHVRAPMPGRVVKVLVAAGDTVAPGQAVAVVEAMKMENDVRAVKGGVVAKVVCVAGATVESNAVLVSFE